MFGVFLFLFFVNCFSFFGGWVPNHGPRKPEVQPLPSADYLNFTEVVVPSKRCPVVEVAHFSDGINLPG